MPQMAPYNWLLLNFYFTMIFMLYNIFMNYMYMKMKLTPHYINQIKFLIKW